jgi:hypothetical protein
LLRASRLWRLSLSLDTPPVASKASVKKSLFNPTGKKKRMIPREKRRANQAKSTHLRTQSFYTFTFHSTTRFSVSGAPSSTEPWICTNHMHAHPLVGR